MKGHQQLLDMRKGGYVPSIVFVETNPSIFAAVHDWHEYAPTRAHVRVEPTDNPDAIDLRCLVGLKVMVNGCDRDRVRKVAQACQRAKAGRVITTVCVERDERFEVVEMTDTEGMIVWPKS